MRASSSCDACVGAGGLTAPSGGGAVGAPNNWVNAPGAAAGFGGSGRAAAIGASPAGSSAGVPKARVNSPGARPAGGAAWVRTGVAAGGAAVLVGAGGVGLGSTGDVPVCGGAPNIDVKLPGADGFASVADLGGATSIASGNFCSLVFGADGRGPNNPVKAPERDPAGPSPDGGAAPWGTACGGAGG